MTCGNESKRKKLDRLSFTSILQLPNKNFLWVKRTDPFCRKLKKYTRGMWPSVNKFLKLYLRQETLKNKITLKNGGEW